jgi:hypothetical protein
VKRSDNTNGIYAGQVQALYQHLPVVLLVNVVNSALVSVVLAASRGQVCWLVFLGFNCRLIGSSCIGLGPLLSE